LARIEASGHSVTNNRVDGGINLSRGIGDWRYKSKASKPEQWAVTCIPDVIRKTLAREDEFIVLGCDGIWDRMSRQQMCNFIRLRLMPRSHWSQAELDLDQGVNPKFYDPYSEFERAVAERKSSRKAQLLAKAKELEAKADKKSKSKSKSEKEESEEKPSEEDDEDCIKAEFVEEKDRTNGEDDDLDDLLKHQKEMMEKMCEPKEDFERYKLWPGDPGVCDSVEDLLKTIAKHVCNNCLSSETENTMYGTDNMTCTIVLFPQSTLGRAVYKRYPRKREGSVPPAAGGTKHRMRSASAVEVESSSGVAVGRSDHVSAYEGEFHGSSSGSPGAGVNPAKIKVTVFTGKTSVDAGGVSAPSTPPTFEAPRKKSKHKKHEHHHHVKVDLTAPMSDAEKLVYQFADEFSDDDTFIVPPSSSDESSKK